MGYIYLRTNKINGKKYVGQVTTKRFKARQNRWNNLNQPYAGNVINAARAKYGIEAFDFEILKECEDEELDYWEMYFIKELNTKAPYGYNLTDGGDGMSGFTVSSETKKKMCEAHKGKKNHMYGKHHSEKRKDINGKLSKQVLQIDKTNKIIAEFPSIMEVERQLGIAHSNISKCCKGKYKTCGGFKWQYN